MIEQRILKTSLIPMLAVLLATPTLYSQMRPTAPPSTSSAWVTGSSFTVDANGQKLGVFHKISGMASALQNTETRRTARGRVGNVTLSEGDIQSLAAFDKWRQQAVDGKIASARQTIVITVSDAKGNAVARYKLINAWPTKVSSGELRAGASGAKVTTVELGYEDLQVLP